MIRDLYFPTPIYILDIKDKSLNVELEKNILDWMNQDKGVSRTNIQGWHSPTNMHEKPEFKKLVGALYEAQVKIYKEECLDSEPVIGNMWANINPTGATNAPHIHPNSHFSGVYYIVSNDKSGALKIDDPRPGAQIVMPHRKQEKLPKHLWKKTFLRPTVGRIIIFPAWLWHSVETNESDQLRISVSFNIIQHGF